LTYKTINARAESVDTAPSYRQAFKKRRCLIPSDGFYEWKKVLGGKIPYSISMKDGAPFVFAGLWEGWKDPANNEWLHTCTIITGEPNEFAAADPYPDVDNSAGRASRCLVIREAGKEGPEPFIPLSNQGAISFCACASVFLQGEAKIGSIRLTLKEGSCNMSSRFFYVQLKFIPKSGLTELPMSKQHGAVVEVPKELVQRKQSEINRP
jgi:SOS response associated peptidase (SRAP)